MGCVHEQWSYKNVQLPIAITDTKRGCAKRRASLCVRFKCWLFDLPSDAREFSEGPLFVPVADQNALVLGRELVIVGLDVT